MSSTDKTTSTATSLARRLGYRGRRTPSAGQRAVLVTGSGRGIGRAIAELFAAEGWKVGVYDISAEAVDWADGAEYVTGILDVTDPEAWKSALAGFLAETGGRLDVLVNNAGLLYGGAFVDSSAGRDSAIVDVNVKGVLFGARAAFEALRATDGSAMVNLCSAASIYGTPEMATYSATKFAVRGITEALDQEWAGEDIVVRDILPFYVRTALLEGVTTAGTSRQGINLTAEQVAHRVLDAALDTNPLAPVHYPVGTKTTLLYNGAHFAPGRVSRALNSLLVGL
ncbi:SDR family oxidoreductase [Dietzia sp.]|uniref:SDR family oxidoreductase n=1 Tax=Dietzia sp. TaxID=1871616 RepID=UPI002FD9B019